METISTLFKKIDVYSWKTLLVVGLLFVSLGIGIYTLERQVTFGYDQARDAFEALSIVNGDIKILGPRTDIEGVYHGPLWYYFLSVPYLVLRGDPQLVATFLFVLSFLTIPLCGYLTYLMFKRRDVAIVAMFLYAFSPQFIAFSKWLSNPSFTLLITPFILYFLWQYLKNRGWKNALVVGVGFGLMTQSDLAFGLILLLLPLYFLVLKVLPKWKEVVWFMAGMGVTSITYLLAEFKFNWRTLPNAIEYATSSHTIGEPIQDRIATVISKLSELFSFGLFPLETIFIGLVVLVLTALLIAKRKEFAKKQFLFLLIWIGNLLLFLLFSTGISTSSFIYAPTIMAFIILTSYVLVTTLPRKIMWVVVAIILVLQVKTTLGWLQLDFTPLSIQRGINVSDAKRVVEYTYQAAGNKPFIINTVTNPLYINTTWSYLYSFHGRQYGFLPFWAGHDQTGLLGGEALPAWSKAANATTLFLIIEPPEGIPQYWIDVEHETENSRSSLVEIKQIGKYVVETRKLL